MISHLNPDLKVKKTRLFRESYRVRKNVRTGQTPLKNWNSTAEEEKS